jgi:hypothetical protein
MLRLARIAAFFVACCAAFVFGVRAIVASNPNSVEVWFTNADRSRCEMPCLFGVRPGETTFKDGVTVLGEHPMLTHFAASPNSAIQQTFGSETMTVTLYGDANTGLVSRITVAPFVNKLRVPMADVVAALGVPDYIFMTGFAADNNVPKVSYFDCRMSLLVMKGEDPEMRYEQPILFMDLRDTPNYHDFGGDHAFTMSWRGFTSVERYYDSYLSSPQDHEADRARMCP